MKWACHLCGSKVRQRYQWKPDMAPTKFKQTCYDCYWTSGWQATPPWEEVVTSRDLSIRPSGRQHPADPTEVQCVLF